MPDNDDNDDRKVKDLLDGGTRADLERWFGLPSFEQLAAQGIAPQPSSEDPEMAERHKRQDEALAAVDPALLDAHRRRLDAMGAVIRQLPPLVLHADPGIARFNMAMLDHQSSIADPKDVERPLDLEEALQERTPQALLRDLHRPESDFYKVFERTDVLAEYRIDLVATIAEAMRREPVVPRTAATPFQETHALLLELRAERRRPWIDIEMPHRRVTE